MTWGKAVGVQRLMPAKSAYGGPGVDGERTAFEASVAAQVNFFDTAAMYSGGGSERRLGELAQGRDVVVATKFPLARSGAPTTCPPRSTRALPVCDGMKSISISTTSRRDVWTSRS